MDRTEEWRGVVRVLCRDDPSLLLDDQPHVHELSVFGRLAQRLALGIHGTEGLVTKLQKLVAKKEFSNDPSEEISQISSLFQTDMAVLRSEAAQLTELSKTYAKQYSLLGSSETQQSQHAQQVVQLLNRKIAKQLELFQKALQTHKQNVEKRRQRTTKYTHRYQDVSATTPSAQFAFLGGGIPPPPASVHPPSGNGVHHAESSSGGGAGLRQRGTRVKQDSAYMQLERTTQQGQPQHDPYQRLSQVHMDDKRAIAQARARQAQQIEAVLAQLGTMFASMANLVAEQSQTISRIEDDVESGLSNAEQAHKHMTEFYNISKGNRSMILKVFGLLLLFILIFTVWL